MLKVLFGIKNNKTKITHVFHSLNQKIEEKGTSYIKKIPNLIS